jgi:hypothetical protein
VVAEGVVKTTRLPPASLAALVAEAAFQMPQGARVPRHKVLLAEHRLAALMGDMAVVAVAVRLERHPRLQRVAMGV